jgi:hypothetical protein
MSASAEEGAKKLLLSFVGSTKRRVWSEDDGNDLFGHLYGDPRSILDSLAMVATKDVNVGDTSLPPPVLVQSLGYECTPYLDVPSPLQSSSLSMQPLDNTSHVAPQLKSWHEIPVQVHNSSTQKLRLRWIDSYHQTKSSHIWDLPPPPSSSRNAASDDGHNNSNFTATWTQYCRPGDFFLFSFVDREDVAEDLFSDDQLSEETVVGAYRPLRPLPSGKFHSIVVSQQRHQDQPDPQHEEKGKSVTNADSATADDDDEEDMVILESVLIDSYDALCVAAASMDPTNQKGRNSTGVTVKLVHKILSNLLNHPNDDRYRTLRLSNAKLQAHVFSSEGALQFLTMAGFERQTRQQPPRNPTGSVENDPVTTEQEEGLLICPDDRTLDEEERVGLVETRVRAVQLLDVLVSRALPSFVPELAPPTPWETPRRLLGPASVNRSGGSRRGMFLSDEERWARAERVARSRRSGRSRRPAPGSAPSSRGSWGR